MRREYTELYFIAFSLHSLVIVLACVAYASVSLQIFFIGWSAERGGQISLPLAVPVLVLAFL